MKKTTLLILTLALVIGTGFAAQDKKSSGSATNGLVKQKGVFKHTTIRPDADFTSYSKIYPRTVTLQFRERVEQQERSAATGSLIRKKHKKGFMVNDADTAKFKEIVHDAYIKELNETDLFEVSPTATIEDTLILRAAILDIVLKIPPSSTRRVDTQIPLIGEGTIVFDLIDAETGTVLARVGERRGIRRVGATVDGGDKTMLWPDISRWAQKAASDLLRQIERSNEG